jgi:hypothetical protein
MKKILLIISLIIVTFSGCFSDSPESSIEKFFNALKDGNIENFRKYSTDSTKALISLQLSMQCSGMNLKNDAELSECMKKTFSNFTKFKAVSSKENGNPTSMIVTLEEYKKDENIIKEDLIVEKFEDEWKVNLKK